MNTPTQQQAWFEYLQALLNYRLNKERAERGPISTHGPVRTV